MRTCKIRSRSFVSALENGRNFRTVSGSERSFNGVWCRRNDSNKFGWIGLAPPPLSASAFDQGFKCAHGFGVRSHGFGVALVFALGALISGPAHQS